ncbi:hypothetical protein [Ketobacter sp.]
MMEHEELNYVELPACDIEATQKKVQNASGRILKAGFGFPGGGRFHFADPGGNEFAIWTDVEAPGTS